MTKEEAKELFRNDKDAYGKPKAIMSKIDKIYADFESENERLKAEREWISVDVEKPKHESDILFMNKNQNIIVGSYDALNNGGFFYDTGFTKRFNVTHWQNLHKPPKQ